MKNQQIIDTINYTSESMELLQTISAGVDYDELKNSFLSLHPTLNTTYTRKLFSLLSKISSEGQHVFKEYKKDLGFYFGKSFSSTKCLAHFVTLWDNSIELFPSTDDLLLSLSRLTEKEYCYRFGTLLQYYVKPSEEADCNIAIESPLDICRSILSLPISDPEKLALQQIFLDPTTHRNRVKFLLDEATRILHHYDREISKVLLGYKDYWEPFLQNQSFVTYLTEEEVLHLEENPFGLTLHPMLINCHGFEANVSSDSPVFPKEPYQFFLGLLFGNGFSLGEYFSTKDLDYLNEQAQRILKLLSDKSKFDILQSIREERSYGKELADSLGLTTATISHHMTSLMSAGLIRMEKEDGKVYYRSRTQELKRVLTYCIDTLT